MYPSWMESHSNPNNMKPATLRINSQHARNQVNIIEKDGLPVLCSTMRLEVTLTNKPKKIVGQNTLVSIIDSEGEEHWVDEFFIDPI